MYIKETIFDILPSRSELDPKRVACRVGSDLAADLVGVGISHLLSVDLNRYFGHIFEGTGSFSSTSPWPAHPVGNVPTHVPEDIPDPHGLS